MNLARTIVIGSFPGTKRTEVIQWKEIETKLPTIIEYNTIVVIPEENTSSEQITLSKLLKDDIKLLKKYPGNIIWILNQYCAIELASKLGLGELIPLRKITGGRVSSHFENVTFRIEDIYFGFSSLSWNNIEVGNYQSDINKVNIPVGLMTVDGTWLLIPNPNDISTLIAQLNKTNRNTKVRISKLASLVLLALMIFLTSSSELKESKSRYISKFSLIGTIRKLPLRFPEDNLDSAWLTPQKRLAARLLSRNRDQFTQLSNYLKPRETAYDSWSNSTARRNAAYYKWEESIDYDDDAPSPIKQLIHVDDIRYYEYALLTGDMNSAIKIIFDADISYASDVQDWTKSITETIWQLTLESLHEADIESAKIFNNIYLMLYERLTEKASQDRYLLGQKIKTLSIILRRELNSSRKVSFLTNPGVKNSFGRFSGESWEFPIPETDPIGLAERREKNLEKYKAILENDAKHSVYYDSLKTLENIRSYPSRYNLASLDQLEVAKFARMESEYLVIKNEIITQITSDTFTKVLEFSQNNSYLVDDLLNVFITQLLAIDGKLHSYDSGDRPDGTADERCIDFQTLYKLLNKIDELDGDSKLIVSYKLKKLDNKWFNLTPESFVNIDNQSRYTQEIIYSIQ